MTPKAPHLAPPHTTPEELLVHSSPTPLMHLDFQDILHELRVVRVVMVSALIALAGFVTSGCSDKPEPTAECVATGAELCGGGDENCDGFTDEPGAVGCLDYLADADGDGRPDSPGSAETRCLCEPIAPWTIEASSVDACGGCDDGNPCTDDTCEAESRTCKFTARAEGDTCEDIDPCTENTICSNGICGGGTEVVCEDASACSVGRCLPGYGCSQVPVLDVVCDDGDACTTLDRCGETGCVGVELPNCGLPFCGDGACNTTDGETCATCPRDCSPMGFGACGGACNPIAPTASTSTCAGVCVPSDGGGVSPEVRSYGNGICGAGCARDADCGGELACLRIFGVETNGVCRPRCDTSNPASCGEGTCIPSPEDSTRGACREGLACDPTDLDACGESFRCTPVGNTAVCLGGCAVNDPIACGGLGCTALIDDRFREGLCLLTTVGCDPMTGGGCDAGSVCAFGADPFTRGRGAFCMPLAAELALGAACDSPLAPCGPGKICVGGRCAELCSPSTGCDGGGTCLDLGDRLAFAEGQVGFCEEVVCGDTICNGRETCVSCERDCGACSVSCGDGLCTAGTETCRNCPADCGECGGCGDGTCAADESCESCPSDCGVCRCGDDQCQSFEDCTDCPADCGPCDAVCGDQICGRSETCERCPGDCPPGTNLCGDGHCDANEDCLSCAADCATLLDGVLRCGTTCDMATSPTPSTPSTPSAAPAASSCGEGASCIPVTADGRLNDHVFHFGDGLCEPACVAGQCAGATCLEVADADLDVCVPTPTACDPTTHEGCAAGRRCVPTLGATTTPTTTPGTAATHTGVCMTPCRTDLTGDCGSGTCRPYIAAEDRPGRCVSAPRPCAPLTPNACPGATCTPLGLAPGQPVLYGCSDGVGTASVFETCDASDACLPGLWCIDGRCHEPCRSGTCPAGRTCTDIGPDLPSLTLTDDNLGVCR